MKFLKQFPGIAIILVLLAVGNLYAVLTANSDSLKSVAATTGQKGDKGNQGDQGAAGTQGFEGATGIPGLTGATGMNGANGAAGQTGTAGTNGIAGLNGTNGTNGLSAFSKIATLHGSLTTGSPANIDTTIPIDSINGSYGTFQQVVTVPNIHYGPGVVAKFNYWDVSNADTTSLDYNVGVDIFVFDSDKTQVLELTGWAHANNNSSNDSASLTSTGLGIENQTGNILHYNASTGEITSDFDNYYNVVVVYVGTL